MKVACNTPVGLFEGRGAVSGIEIPIVVLCGLEGGLCGCERKLYLTPPPDFCCSDEKTVAATARK